MKFALRGLLVLSVAAVVAQAGAAAPRLHTVPYAGFFWTPHKGLIGVGLCASTKYMCGTGAVELTTDGGRTYRIVLRTRHPVSEVQSLGQAGAIARVGPLAGNVRRVFHTYRTLDGGRSWTRWHAAEGVSYATRRFGLGFRHNYDLGAPALSLLRTQDGGRTWRRLPAPPSGLCAWLPILDLVTAKSGRMLCIGQPGAGTEEKALFRTRDGGRTWRELTSAGMTGGARPGGIGSVGYPAGISFTRNGFGLLWESRGTLFVTRDGGKKWRRHSRFAVFDVDFGLGGSAFANGTGFVLYQHAGTTERLIETRDYGRTWHVVRRWGT